MEDKKQNTDNQNTDEDIDTMETFDETKVEPLNFTRQSLYEDTCLSYL
jgi:hypothetical protein